MLIEPKRADQIALDEAQAKRRASVRWCAYASQHAESTGGKPWHYLLIPDDEIALGRSVVGFLGAQGVTNSSTTPAEPNR